MVVGAVPESSEQGELAHAATNLFATGAIALVASMTTPIGATAGFGDVVPGRFSDAPVQGMAEEGITTGTTATTYSPDDMLARGQMAALIFRGG